MFEDLELMFGDLEHKFGDYELISEDSEHKLLGALCNFYLWFYYFS